jgi:CubicO group peptidase (beta-lactamase class C family)
MPEITWPDEDWEFAVPQEMGLNESALASASNVLARSSSNARAMVVVRHGRIAWESYFHGSTQDDRWHLFSVTKSVISSLIGIALQNGDIQNIDQPVTDFFPEYSFAADNPIGLVTVRHLLTMRAGFLWPGGHRGIEPMADRLRRSPDWTRFILELPVRREEMGQFHYCSAASHLLSAVLTRATGQSACLFAQAHLFEPLGIRGISPGMGWETDPQQLSIGGWGLHLTARELARFGWLYLCRGKWRDHIVLPESWVIESTQNGKENGYGFQWWLRRAAGHLVFAGLGFGGQYLFCVPELNLEVIILSQSVHRWPDRWEWLQTLLAHIIL